MGKEQCSSYYIFRSSKEERLLEDLKKKKNLVQGRSWNGYCQIPALGRDLVWLRLGLVGLGCDMNFMS